MAELLLELRSEEIPARMQNAAASDLKRLLGEGLKKAALAFDGTQAYVTPRRLTVVVDGLPLSQSDVAEERRGPRVDAPEKAIEGFLRSAGITRDEAFEREEKKGTFLYAKIESKGGSTESIISEMIPIIIRNFPWPKSMRWGSGGLRWVRPLQSILCLLDGKIVSFEVDGIESGQTTAGHRFMSPDTFSVTDSQDYQKKMLAASVILNPDVRKKRIQARASALAEENGLRLGDDPRLLAEVAGLVEWPVPLLGSFDQKFLKLPPECLISEMRGHQKYLPLFDLETGNLSPHFIAVANLDTPDTGVAITGGNERVLAARLSDAEFFWEKDQKIALADRVDALSDIIFHTKLGTLRQKVERVGALAASLAVSIPGCDGAQAARAAYLCKADLVTGMVGEFPDLQGVMGRYYALAEGENTAVADAIRDHYSPLGPKDSCPKAPLSVAVALADKFDTLVGFFAIGEKPTGSKDPFALRRAALGVIRLITENGLRLNLNDIVAAALDLLRGQKVDYVDPTAQLLSFFAERLQVIEREKGVRHDHIDAVFSVGGEDDLVRLLARVSALSQFLGSDDGESLLAGYKRAANIVRIEEKKSDRSFLGGADASLFEESAEITLWDTLATASDQAGTATENEEFSTAMSALASLRTPIDEFFEQVTVNSDQPQIRENRLRLLNAIRTTMDRLADFSRIEG